MLWWYIILSGLYTLSLLYIIYTWYQWPQIPPSAVSVKVSVIIPFRNEVLHLKQLVNSLEKQSYQSFEVLFVNDHSEDPSEDVLKKALKQVGFEYQLIDLNETTGKKSAIARGVEEATGEIILTSDADCSFGPDWIAAMAGVFSEPHTQLVSGPVMLEGDLLFQHWQQMEFAVLIAVGAVGIKSRKPSMANGANLAYRKEAFEAVKGFEGIDDIASGDDELLLMKINSQFPDSISFLKKREALVKTEALASWKDFRYQRLRWAGKWKYGKRLGTIVGALAVFVFSLSLIALPGLAISEILPWWLVIFVFANRLLMEFILVISLAGFFRYRLSLMALLLHQILYPFYAVYFGMAANFGKYKWKGRSYSSRTQ